MLGQRGGSDSAALDGTGLRIQGYAKHINPRFYRTGAKGGGCVAQVPDWSRDNAAGRTALQLAGLEVFESTLHLEGGSIHVDGEGCAGPFGPAWDPGWK